MTSAGEVVVNVSGRDVNLVALLNRLDASLRKTDQAGLKLSQTTGGTLTQAQQRAANATIAEAQAMARAAVAVGDNARAHEILVGALGRSAGATDRSVASLTASIGRLQSSGTFAAQFGDSLKSSLLGIVGPAAVASAALAGVGIAVRATEDAFKLKASLDETRQSITSLLGETRNSGQVFAEAAVFANRYKLTQQETNSILSSSVDILRTSSASVGELEANLLRLQSRDVSKPISEAARALRELQAGDVTSIKELFNVPREDALRMKNEIQGGADAVRVLGDYLDRAGIGMQVLENRTQGAAGKMRELEQANERFSLALAGQAGGPGLAILEARIAATGVATRALEGDTISLNSALGLIGAVPTGLIAYNAEVARMIGILPEAAASTEELVAASAFLGGSMDAERQATALATDAVTIHAAAEAQRRGELLAGGEAAGNAARMIEQTANASQIAGQEAQLQALQTQILAAEANNAAAAFLNLNPGIDQAGIRAAANAGLVPQLTARIAELTLQIRDAKSELGQATGKGGGPGLSASSFATSQQFFNKNQREAAAAAAAAQREQTLAVGSTADKMALLNRELEAAKRNYGEGSAQAIRAQTAIDQAVDRSSKKTKGAGAARLSDTQKLHNSLLADQEKFAQQAEDAAKEHGKRLLDIEEEYQKKSLAQQKANELSKRASEIDFLKALTSSELNATKEGRAELARIDAQYYADFDAAQKAAQAGNVEQSERMVEQARRRADVELEYAEKIAEAREKKDKGEVERLEALREKERQLLAEQEKQIAEGGDADVKAKNEAIADEEQRYAEAQGKIGTAAENAEERKVNAAIRSGKAIDAENAKLRDQEAIYNRIGGPGGVATPAGGAPTPPTTTAPGTTPTAAGPIDMGAVVSAIERSIAVLESIRRAVQESTGATTGAIGRLGSRLAGA